MNQKAFVLNEADHVATALDDLKPGVVQLLGESPQKTITCVEEVPFGHKIALCDREPTKEIRKNNVVIGLAHQPITTGQWVHLHNIQSQVDERSGTLDKDTGAPTEDDVYR